MISCTSTVEIGCVEGVGAAGIRRANGTIIRCATLLVCGDKRCAFGEAWSDPDRGWGWRCACGDSRGSAGGSGRRRGV